MINIILKVVDQTQKDLKQNYDNLLNVENSLKYFETNETQLAAAHRLRQNLTRLTITKADHHNFDYSEFDPFCADEFIIDPSIIENEQNLITMSNVKHIIKTFTNNRILLNTKDVNDRSCISFVNYVSL